MFSDPTRYFVNIECLRLGRNNISPMENRDVCTKIKGYWKIQAQAPSQVKTVQFSRKTCFAGSRRYVERAEYCLGVPS